MVMSTAATSFVSGGLHLRMYSSDGVTITEKCWDKDGPWYVGAFKGLGQYVSATSWVDSTIHIRVYCTNAGVTTEYCWDGDGPWYKGAYE
jgi:Fungal fucose-specific lectin